MKVTSVNVKPLNPAKGNMVARVSMTVDGSMALRGMALIHKGTGSYYLSMPLFKEADSGRETKPFFPISNDTRQAMTEAAVSAYEEALGEQDKQENYIYDLGSGDGLKVTKISLFPTKTATAKSLAFASIVIDDAIVLNHIRLVEKADGSRYLSMPNFPIHEKGSTLVNVYHPVSGEARTELTDLVFAEWDKRKEKAAA